MADNAAVPRFMAGNKAAARRSHRFCALPCAFPGERGFAVTPGEILTQRRASTIVRAMNGLILICGICPEIIR